MLSHFSGLDVGFAVQRTHSPPLLVISRQHFSLFSSEGGTVARLQISFFAWGLVLRFGTDEFGWFDIRVCFKLRPVKQIM